MGIVHLILQGISVIQNELTEAQRKQLELIVKDIDTTMSSALKIQSEDGNFPSSFQKQNEKLVQFCHGASGVVQPLVLIHKFTNK